MIRLILAFFIFALGAPLWADNPYMEHVGLYQAKMKNASDLGTGWPDVPEYTFPGGAGIFYTGLDFDAGSVEAYCGTWHPLHQVTRTGNLYVDLHYCMTSAHAGTVRMTLDLWKVNAGDDLASLNAATATTSWTINPNDAARIYDYNFYTIPYSGTIQGGQMGVINMATLGITSRQCEVFYRLRRDATDGTNDTHTGELSLFRMEFHYQCTGVKESAGE